jgi:site-specific recombinase
LALGIVACLVLPMSYSIWVGTTRIIDYWHHPSDVIAGLCLGFLMGNVGYHVHFPNPLVDFALAVFAIACREPRTIEQPRLLATSPSDAVVTNPCVPWIIRDIHVVPS